MEVCYEYVGLVAWWYDLGAEAQVACVAAVIALLIYALNRWHARSDLLAKRKALHAIVRRYIESVVKGSEYIDRAIRHEKDDSPSSWKWLELGASVGERIVELQLHLVSVARHGDEAITEFIEACRLYAETAQELRKAAVRFEENDGRVEAGFTHPKTHAEWARKELRELLALGPKAKAALAKS